MKAEEMAEIENLVEKYRDQCLWFLRQDFIPRSAEEVLHVLNLIERYGDRAGFERAQRLRQWLQLPLGELWHAILATARKLCRCLPAAELGKCVISRDSELFRGSAEELTEALNTRQAGFHHGRLGGSWPVFR